MANKALFWYNYKRFVDEGTIKPLSPKTFALSGTKLLNVGFTRLN